MVQAILSPNTSIQHSLVREGVASVFADYYLLLCRLVSLMPRNLVLILHVWDI